MMGKPGQGVASKAVRREGQINAFQEGEVGERSLEIHLVAKAFISMSRSSVLIPPFEYGSDENAGGQRLLLFFF